MSGNIDKKDDTLPLMIMVTLAIMVMVTLARYFGNGYLGFIYYGDGYLGALHTASTLVQGVLPALTA